MADRKRVCVVNAVCGNPDGKGKGEARWWFKMSESPVDHDYYPQFAEIDGPFNVVPFGVPCCQACKDQIMERWQAFEDEKTKAMMPANRKEATHG